MEKIKMIEIIPYMNMAFANVISDIHLRNRIHEVLSGQLEMRGERPTRFDEDRSGMDATARLRKAAVGPATPERLCQ
jgi:hypothetical protein